MAEKKIDFDKENNKSDDSKIIGYEIFSDGIKIKNVGNTKHSNICDNLDKGIYSKLKDKNCKVKSENLFVRSEMTRKDFIPDIVVFCGDTQVKDIEQGPNKGRASVDDALLIIEVLSPKTEYKDIEEKWDSYCRLPSIVDIAYFSRDAKRIELNTRQNDGSWSKNVITQGDIEFKSIDVSISLDEIY